MAGEARQELIDILRAQRLVVGGAYSPQAQIVDALLANPDVVLRALGGTLKTSDVPQGAVGWSLWWLPIETEE